MTKKISWMLLAALVFAAPAAAQSQYQGTFELGVGYTRPAVEKNIDMISFLLQADEFFVESGIGLRLDGETAFSWLVRGGYRAFALGNVKGHVGAEFSLHTNSTQDSHGGAATLVGLGFLAGASYQVADHLNLALHLYPLAFDFGGASTVTKLGVAEIGMHLLF